MVNKLFKWIQNSMCALLVHWVFFCYIAKDIAISTVQASFSKRHQNYFHVKFAVSWLRVTLCFQGVRPGMTENRDELVLEQNSFRYHVKGPWKFLFREHLALLSCLNTINFNNVEATTAFNCFAATETTISDHKEQMF